MNKRNAGMRGIIGVLFFCVSTWLWAGQSASMTCTKRAQYYNNDNQTYKCEWYELRVKVTTDNDVGLPGAFGVGVQLEDHSLAYWTINGGFQEYKGGLVQPADGITLSLPAVREYLVFSGPPAQLCALSLHQQFDLYAGHGAVPAEREAQVQRLLSYNLPFSVDHIRGAYIQADVNKNPWKAGLIYTWKPIWCDGSLGAETGTGMNVNWN